MACNEIAFSQSVMKERFPSAQPILRPGLTPWTVFAIYYSWLLDYSFVLLLVTHTNHRYLIIHNIAACDTHKGIQGDTEV
jgi:hypothetical protein